MLVGESFTVGPAAPDVVGEIVGVALDVPSFSVTVVGTGDVFGNGGAKEIFCFDCI